MLKEILKKTTSYICQTRLLTTPKEARKTVEYLNRVRYQNKN